MKKICLIIPYYGKLPNYFNIWLKSCEYNETIDFLIVTDNIIEAHIPKNVRILKEDFTSLKKRFQKEFDFKINLDTPYKLCDYRPSYGQVFKEELKKYEYWGYCDMDLIFGDIRKFIKDEILEKNDKILTRGHFTLYKNTADINSIYKKEVVGCQSYKDVFQTSNSCCFDEWAGHCGNGVSEIFRRLEKKQYNERIFADLKFKKCNFILSVEKCKSSKRIFTFDKGVLNSYIIDKKNKCIKEEYMYCHFQKRNPKIYMKNINYEKFIFMPPNQFIEWNSNDIDTEFIMKLNKNKKIYLEPIKYYIKRFKQKLLG